MNQLCFSEEMICLDEFKMIVDCSWIGVEAAQEVILREQDSGLDGYCGFLMVV